MYGCTMMTLYTTSPGWLLVSSYFPLPIDYTCTFLILQLQVLLLFLLTMSSSSYTSSDSGSSQGDHGTNTTEDYVYPNIPSKLSNPQSRHWGSYKTVDSSVSSLFVPYLDLKMLKLTC
jgi:hypothetical protein